MRGRRALSCLAPVLIVLLATGLSIDASLGGRFLLRRQSSSGDGAERETTTPKSNQIQGANNENRQQPSRLYPDLPQPPMGNGFMPAVGAQPAFAPVNQPPTQFLPFQPQLPGNTRFNDPRLMPRPMSSAERIQSQTFTNGLGQRLLAMVGIKPQESNETSTTDGQPTPQTMNPQDTMKALQNSTVLQQLNKGVSSIYGSLSKMYNETVQQQLNMLQDKFKQESENSTNPWQQRMAQRVPQFFKSMADRVDAAQENLNKLWQDVMSAQNGTMNLTQVGAQNAPPRGFFGSFDQFMGNGPDGSGGFFDQFGRQFGLGGGAGGGGSNPPSPTERQDGQGMDIGAQLRFFWQNQVQPQIGAVRGQIARTWRDLTQSGALAPEPMIRPRQNGNNLGGGANNSVNSDLVDSILKEVDLNSPEYTLVDQRGDQPQQAPPNNLQQNMLSNQMQNGLMTMQRELNQLWMGLSKSLQSAVRNVRNTLNPQPAFGPMDAMASEENRKEVDPAENEIDGKIKDMSKLQRQADAVYNVVQQQQNAQQQRMTFGDRFRNFFETNFGNVDQLPARLGDSMNRFGTVVNDLWHQIPERWDNFVNRQRDSIDSGRLTAPASSQTSTTPASTPAASENRS